MDIEKTEILDYDTVYWMDLKERISKKAPPQVPDGIDNDGFDNDKNEYNNTVALKVLRNKKRLYK